MLTPSHEKHICVLVGESQRADGKPCYMAILDFLRGHGVTNVLVGRGIAGIDANSRLHAAGVITLSVDLPLKIEWIDSKAHFEELLPGLESLIGNGQMSVYDTEVYPSRQTDKGNILNQSVSTIMTTPVTTLLSSTPIADVVALLIEGGFHSLPVIDSGQRVIGIVTNGDLLRNTSLPVRLGLQPSLTDEQVQADFETLRESERTIGEIMSMPVTTIRQDETVRQAGALMVEKKLKRLPVVDADNRIAGVVSRVDVMASMGAMDPSAGKTASLPTGYFVRELMNADAPWVLGKATLPEIVDALEESRQQRVVVLDQEHAVLGVITDGDLLQRSMYGKHPTLQERLRGLVTGAKPASFNLPRGDETAVQLMTTPAITLPVDAALGDALSLMLKHHLKRLPVVDEDERFVGVLGRSSVLRGLVHG